MDLRAGPAEPMHERQLALILATAGRYRGEMETWGRSFAALHGLDFAGVLRSAARTRLRRRPRSMLTRIMRKFGVHEAGSPELPIANVVEAGRYAAGVLNRNISKGT
jgi:hypothetical protein